MWKMQLVQLVELLYEYNNSVIWYGHLIAFVLELNRLFQKTEAKQLARQGFCPPIRRDDLRIVF